MSVPLRRNPDFTRLWVGQAVSNLGISISAFAYPVLVLERTGSAVRAGLVGPPIAGALLAVSRALPFLADAVSYLVSLAAVATVRTPLGGRERASGRPLAELTTGLRWITARPFLRALLLWFLAASVVFGSLGLVALVLARERGATPSELGAMAAITGVGAAGGSLLAPRLIRLLRPLTLILGFAALAAVATFLLLAVRSPYSMGVLGGCAFALVPAVNALAFVEIAEHAGDELQGRVTSAAIQVASLGAPVGPILAGGIAAWLGAREAVIVYGAALVALGLAALATPSLRG